MSKHTIQLTEATVRNELQEKLKNLKKFEASDEFEGIKGYCKAKTEELEQEIRKALAKRKEKVNYIEKEETLWGYRVQKHDAVYSELDLMVMNQIFLETLKSMAKDKTFLAEIDENLEALESHLFLQTGNFDFCVYSELDGMKHEYKLNMGIEHTVKQMITKYELQEKDVDVDQATNAYATPKSQPIGEIE